MNKKNRGFTLVEVIATLTIIAIITVIATVTYNRVRYNIINREYENLKALIESAAIKYTAKTGKPNYFVQELIDEGYLEPDDDSPEHPEIPDPRDNHPLNCHLVEVKLDKHGNYEATLRDKSYMVDGECDPSVPTQYGLTISAKITKTNIDYLNSTGNGSKLETPSDNIYKNINILYLSGSRWTNKQLDLTANISTNQGNYFELSGAKYIWNRNTDNTTYDPTFTTKVYEFYNNYYYLDVYTKDNTHLQGRFMYKYDKQKPVIYELKTRYANPLEENQWKKEKVILIYATDLDGVGIDRIYAGSRPCEDLLKDPTMGVKPTPGSQIHRYTVREETGKDGENGNINLCAVDMLGNLADTGSFNAKKIDITPPQCDKVIGQHNKYQKLARTVHQYCIDDNYINGKNVIGSQCTQDPFPKTWDTTTERDIITIRDNVGWETECTVDVFVDTTPPICDYQTGNTQYHINNNGANTTGLGSTDNWDHQYRFTRQYCRDDNAGCYEPYSDFSWQREEGTTSSSIITTDSFTIYDATPKCSQTSVTSGNCSNYESIKNTNENLIDYRNSTVCGAGVYIDHVKPIVTMKTKQGHPGNKMKISCSDDCNGNCSDYSDVKTFTVTTNGQTQTNDDGSELAFRFNSVGTYTINYTCEDNAGNVESGSDTFTVVEPPSDGVVPEANGKTCTYEGKTCIMKGWRTWSGYVSGASSCMGMSYDCYCEDKACSDASNSGAGSTCCLLGEKKELGCKNVSSSETDFGTTLSYDWYGNSAVGSYYMYWDHAYYKLPYDTDTDCIGTTGSMRCQKGRRCYNYNCYPDNPTTSRPMLFICGNYEE